MSRIHRTTEAMPAVRPAAPAATRPDAAASSPRPDARDAFQSFSALKPVQVKGEPRHHHPLTVQGRRTGTPDDSIGRRHGTPDDSIGLDSVLYGQRDPRLHTSTGLDAWGRDGRSGLVLSLPGDALKRAMKGVHSKGRDAMLAALRYDRNAARVFSSSAFQKLDADDRTRVAKLMVGPVSTAAVAELIRDRRLGVLLQNDRHGVSVLDHLSDLKNEGHPELATATLADLADPKRIQQGYAPTCTATSMQYELAKETPAEYARLMAGLGCDGAVTMAGGGELKVNAARAEKWSARNHDFRTSSEAVFQSAVMEFANGKDDYDLKQERSEGARGNYRGLYPGQIRRMVGALFGERYETREIRSDRQAADELRRIAERERPNRPVLFDISMGSYNHNVSFERVQHGKVYFRDPTTGEVEHMRFRTFINRLTSVHYAAPKDAPVTSA